MAQGKRNKILNADVIFAFFIGMILFVLMFPLPTFLLSGLLVVNIALSLVVLLIVFYLKKSLEISSYPMILLILTLFRLALNVASTKLILLEANAGSVIEAFGRFVVGNNYIIGAVVFIILVIINFIVIVKGSSRIAEVAARFTLDAMPGKQMSIDSDLNAGIIDETEARKKRDELSKEAEFYGAMDGASKFVTGDAVAGIMILAVNIIGGIAIGILQMGMPVVQALQTYSILTIGDGLVTQIPALLISVSAGMLVSRTESDHGGAGTQLFSQLFRRHQPLFLCATMLAIIALLPGFPFMPFATLAAASFFAGMWAYKRNMAEGGEEEEEEALAVAGASGGKGGRPGKGGQSGKAGKGGKAVEGGDEQKKLPAGTDDTSLPKIHPMSLEIGFSLVPLVDPNQEGDLVDRIAMIRKQIKEEMGFLIPPISIQDNIELANNEYRILVRGLERARGMVHATSHLAINPGDVSGQIEGVRTVDPAFGFEAVWISSARVNAAESMGYTVVDASSVITTHVTKVVKDYAAELISRQDVSDMLEQVRMRNETVVNELVPQQLTVGAIHRVLQHLLDEKVPIHDLASVLETISDFSHQTKDPVILCEFARQALKGHIIASHLGEERTLHAITMDPRIEDEIQQAIGSGSGGGILSLSPERALEITDAVKNTFDRVSKETDNDIVLLVSPLIRLHMFRMLRRKMEEITVVSYSEVTDDVPLKVMGTVTFGGNTNDEEGIAA